MIAAILLLSFATIASAAKVPTAPGSARNPAAVQQVMQGKQANANAAWWGFNATDSTAALQAAFDSKAKRVLIPYMGKPWIVRSLFLRSNQEIDLAPGVVILTKRGEFKGTGDSLLTASNVSNLTIRGYGATLRMWKHDYQNPPYKKAEWRMGIALRGVKNVRIEGLRIENTGGDGFYITGGGKGRLWSEDVTIRDCVADGNNRQGVSVISAVNLTIENCTFSNTSGTAPEAGIDLEPNEPNQRLQNIVIRNSIFENNQGDGMVAYLDRFNSTTAPVSILFDHCVTRMTQPTGGGRGMSVAHVRDGTRGVIEFRDSTVESAGKEDVLLLDKSSSGIQVRFVRCHWNRAWNSPHPKDKGPYVPIRFQLGNPKVAHQQGNVEFVECYLYDTMNRPAVLATDDYSSSTNVRDVHGHITVENPNGVRMELGSSPVNTDLVVAAAK